VNTDKEVKPSLRDLHLPGKSEDAFRPSCHII